MGNIPGVIEQAKSQCSIRRRITPKRRSSRRGVQIKSRAEEPLLLLDQAPQREGAGPVARTNAAAVEDYQKNGSQNDLLPPLRGDFRSRRVCRRSTGRNCASLASDLQLERLLWETAKAMEQTQTAIYRTRRGRFTKKFPNTDEKNAADQTKGDGRGSRQKKKQPSNRN